MEVSGPVVETPRTEVGTASGMQISLCGSCVKEEPATLVEPGSSLELVSAVMMVNQMRFGDL